MMHSTSLLLALFAIASTSSAFTSWSRPGASTTTRPYLSNSHLSAKRKTWTQREKSEILGRNGEYFKLDRMRGKIAFGSSSRIQTTLDTTSSATDNESSIRKWLSNDEQIATSIWDPKLIQRMDEPNVYRLKLMTLMFVTIQLAPHVDVKMYTDDRGHFNLESVAFDPNIQILPGVGVSVDSLGILIDVVGELYPSEDGKGVDGKIGFVTSGELPPPMRLLPEPVLKASLSTINRTITNFAINSFQKGAKSKYREFVQSEKRAAGAAQAATATSAKS